MMAKKNGAAVYINNTPVVIDEGIEELKAAIVLMAIKDYMKPPKGDSKKKIRNFFKSNWCKSLIDIDSKTLISMAENYKANDNVESFLLFYNKNKNF